MLTNLNLTPEQQASYQRKWQQLCKKKIVLTVNVTLKLLINQFSIDYDTALYIKERTWHLTNTTTNLSENGFYLILKYVHAYQNNLNLMEIQDIRVVSLNKKLLPRIRNNIEENPLESRLQLDSFFQFDQRDVQEAKFTESQENKKLKVSSSQQDQLQLSDDDMDFIFDDDEEDFEIIETRTSTIFEYIKVNSYQYVEGKFFSLGYYIYEIHSKPITSKLNIVVFRRQNDFEKLDQQLKNKHSSLLLPEFPQKRWFQNTNNSAHIRKNQFQFYLNELSCIEQIENENIFKSFLTKQEQF